jgi:hypothetical protein
MLMGTAAFVMAAMMVAMSMPAFAGGGGKKDPCQDTSTNVECTGGSGAGGGGQGGGGGANVSLNLESGEYFYSSGGGSGGQGGSGGSGGHCSGNIYTGFECKGGSSF